MIRLASVRKSYGAAGGAPVHALRAVDLEIAAGAFVAVTGPSGCGKSTLLHLLGGLDRPDGGEVFVAGRPVHALDERGLTELRRATVGIVFQFFNLLPTLTAFENVELPALLQGLPAREARDRAAELLEEVGLGSRAGHQPHQLSGGEMQRTALARALVMKPPVLLADEPTGNLDSEASAKVVDLFRRLGARHGTTIVMVTHSREVAAAADREIALRDGRIVGTGA
jgi:ABC-type lipoprotein export system ATPase subunit